MAQSKPLLDAHHTVLTPEHVEFDFVLAGLYSRFVALLVDQLAVITLSVGIVAFTAVALSWAPGFATAVTLVAWFVVDWGYGIAFETAWAGQTPGKRALGLRVLQESGVRIHFYHAVLRNLARAFDKLPILYLVGGTAALFSRSHQRFGDMLAGTIVVRERKLKIPASISRPEGDRQLLNDPGFLSRVAKLNAEEQEVIFSAAIRREELALEARLKLFAALSNRLQREVGFSKLEHLSDEKFVLLVAAALAANVQRAGGRAPARASG